MKKTTLAAGILIIALAVVVLLAALNTGASAPGPQKTVPLTVGGPALETSALVYIAQDQHFFEKNGLNVTFREYDSGGTTIGGLTKGDVDIGLMSEFVMVNGISQGDNLTGIATTDKFQNMFLVTRKDRGINSIADLKGRTVGLPEGTIAEFYMGRYLTLHGMDADEVNLVNVRPAQTVEAVENGTFDAVVTWHPFLDTILGQNSTGVAVWPIQSGQLTYWTAVSRRDWADSHRPEMTRFLRSLADAEQYMMYHPDDAQRIVEKRLNYTDTYIGGIWQDNQFSLSLDQSLITAMEDESRWLISGNSTTMTTIPDFRNVIDPTILGSIKPGSADIMR